MQDVLPQDLKYIYEKKEFDYVIPMDGDGEDRPEEIKNFIELAEQTDGKSIVGERVKRSESSCYSNLVISFINS